jgi:RNA polymerase sigma factor (sigma-70 family)
MQQSGQACCTYVFVWSLSDESLLAGLASGDPDAAAVFVRRFQARVYGLALTVVGDPGAAEEVAQETFVRAWRHATAFDPRKGRVATWLLSIARNLAIDVIRMRRCEPLDPQSLVAMQLTSPDEGPDERSVVSDESRRLMGELAQLPEDQKRALILAAFYGRTAREISDLVGAPVGTVKTRIRTAMLKLRSALEVADEQ